MTCANAKPAALTRLWRYLTRKAVKHGLPRPALFISRRSSGIGSNGAQATGEASCPQNAAIPTIETLISARAEKATNISLRSLYQRKHMSLIKGSCYE